MPNFRAVVDEPIPAKYIRTALSLTSKLNLVIVKPPKLDSFVQLRGFTSYLFDTFTDNKIIWFCIFVALATSYHGHSTKEK